MAVHLEKGCGMLTRRDLLKLSLLGGSTLIFPLEGLLPVPHAVGAYHDGGGGSPRVQPFQVPLPIPSVLTPAHPDPSTDYYEITMRQAEQEIIPGTRTTIWGYNGLFPGPTIVARSGRKTVVRQINNLPENMVVHLHGGHNPPERDGYPTDYIPPGGYKDYVYPNNQIAATLWFHDHTMDITGPHVYYGLAAFYILEDDVEAALPLPRGDNDVALAIQDRLFNADGSFNYPLTSQTLDTGVLGDTILVNGAVQPYFQVGTRKMRFRILNGSNAREYELALSSGQSFVQIGTEGGLLPAPIVRPSIRLAPAERADVVIDFSGYSLGSQIVLKNRLGSGSTGDIMRLDVVRSETDDSTVPSALRPLEVLQESSAVRTRTFYLSRDWRTGLWVINGKPFDPARVDAMPRLGDVEVWRFQNRSGMLHPMHLHDVMFQVLEINGRRPVYGRAWKDTVPVPAWGEARVITRFDDYLGTYVFHCHNIEHEDYRMMSQFEVMP